MRRLLNYTMLASVVVTFVIALSSDFCRSSAKTTADFEAEVHEIEEFVVDFGKFYDQMIVLKRNSSPAADKKKSLTQQRDLLKERLPFIEKAFRSIVDKLKADGRWDGLDAEILRAVTDRKLKRVIEQGGGATKILEDAESLLSSADEISSSPGNLPVCSTPAACVPPDTSNVRESGLKMIAASYDPSIVLFKDSLACKIARGVLIARGPHASTEVVNRAWCFCVEMPENRNETLAQCMQNNSVP